MDVRYLTLDEVVAYHVRLLAAQGKPPMPIIAQDKLEAALARPQATALGEDLFQTTADTPRCTGAARETRRARYAAMEAAAR